MSSVGQGNSYGLYGFMVGWFSGRGGDGLTVGLGDCRGLFPALMTLWFSYGLKHCLE